MERKIIRVVRGVGHDVSEELYLKRLEKLAHFVETFNLETPRTREELDEIIRDNAKRISTIIRATGTIEPTIGNDWVAYNPIIKTDRLIVALLRDQNLIDARIANRGFDIHRQPREGFQLKLPLQKEKWNWDDRILRAFDVNGKIISINNNRHKLKLIAKVYKEVVTGVVEYATNKNI